MYVGRFLKDFGNLESMVNAVFATMFDLDAWGAMLLQANLGFAQKLQFVRVSESRGLTGSKPLNGCKSIRLSGTSSHIRSSRMNL